jgi:hypothetical protein
MTIRGLCVAAKIKPDSCATKARLITAVLSSEVQNRIEAVDQGMISFTQLSPA